MKDYDGVLVLLQDIKDILYGIVLLLAGGIMCLTGLLLGGWGILLLCVGVFVCIGGIIYARRGYHHHEVEENPD